MVRTSFNLLIFKTNLGKELGINSSKSSNEKQISNLTHYSYFFILFGSIAIYAIKRNRRYQKDCWHWEKKSKELKRLQQTSFLKPKKKCSRVFFMKIETNSHVSQIGTVFFTQNLNNRTICFVILVFNKIHNKFQFLEVFSQKSFKTFIKKIKRLKCRLPNCKKYSGMCNQHVSWKK